MIADPLDRSADSAPVHGKEGRQDVGLTTLHNRWIHRPKKVLHGLLDCLNDVPKSWRRVLARGTDTCEGGHCDACLQANADKVPSNTHAPDVQRSGDLISFDTYTTGLSHMHGGERYVLGFHDHYSGVGKVYLMQHKNDAVRAIAKYLAWCNAHNVTVRRVVK